MPIEIEMPRLSAETGSATLATWLVSVGDRVAKGDVIAELETDKSTVELEAPASGTILQLDLDEGTEDIPSGTRLGLLEPEPAHAASEESGTDEGRTGKTPGETTTPRPTRAAPEPAAHARSTREPTPLARRVASLHRVDLDGVAGSGPRGRVVEKDVLGMVGAASGAMSSPAVDTPSEGKLEDSLPAEPDETGAGPAGFESVRLSAMRKTIARRMSESKREIPHFYLSIRCPMDAVFEARARLNAELADVGREVRISVNDFIVRAAALALREVPAANVSFAGDEMRVHRTVDISVAVATDGGLVTPVLRDADRKGLAVLAQEIRSLARAAREGKLRPEQYQGGTFTISNLGMYGIESVYPILNPPQACILGVGAAEQEPIVRSGEIVVGQVASLTLAADHRVVDGAVGAELLSALRARLEDPLGMML